MSQSRRDFLKTTGCTALSAAAMASGIEQLGRISAYAQSSAPDYKALVCIFLDGGNDGNNMVIPYDDYAPYDAARGLSGLAIPKSDLLQISPASQGGNKFGFNPRLSPEVAGGANVAGGAGLLPIWDAGKLAVLTNVGTLIAPLTKTQYFQRPDLRPYQIGSHSDQQDQHMTSISNSVAVTGWGGRTADTIGSINNTSSGPPPLPMVVSIAGQSIFGTGANSRPLAVAGGQTQLNQILLLNFTSPVAAEKTSRGFAFDKIRGINDPQLLTKAYNETIGGSLLAATALSRNPTLPTVANNPMPNNGLAQQLLQVLRIMAANLDPANQAVLGLKRQIFFTRIGGFDTHSNQRIGGQDSLLQALGQSMRWFYNMTVAMNLADKVTTFTLSDFNRTFDPSGTGIGAVGTDHAWGNHQFVMGGAVRGATFYGTFPTLVLKGPDDSEDRGRWIPTTSVDQYAATLAKWYGVPAADIDGVFPYVNRFATKDLGFMM